MNLYSKIKAKLSELKEADAFRFLKQKQENDSSSINLATNDYLAIAQNQEFLNEFHKQQTNLPLTASSSRLLSGNHKYYTELEQKLSLLYNSESALFFNSGYHLNIGVLPSITKKNDLILADKLVHASLIEAIKLSSAKTIRYKHLDYKQLELLLSKYKNDYENIFIVSESIFSMDGDKVDLQKLVQLKQKYNAYLYLDEAHAVGVCGTKGLGISEQENLISKIDFIVGTMGKALSSIGAYLICTNDIKSYLINNCRSLIYTTALPPINIAWSSFVLDKSITLEKERITLNNISKTLKTKLHKAGIKIVGDSHILAIIVGGNLECLNLAKRLSENGITVQAIRPPTVPLGTSRIRISLHSNLSQSEIEKIVTIITKYAN